MHLAEFPGRIESKPCSRLQTAAAQSAALLHVGNAHVPGERTSASATEGLSEWHVGEKRLWPGRRAAQPSEEMTITGPHPRSRRAPRTSSKGSLCYGPRSVWGLATCLVSLPSGKGLGFCFVTYFYKLCSSQNRVVCFILFTFLCCVFYFILPFLWWILSYIEMNQPWVYMCSPYRSPLPPPSPPAPSGSSQCTRSEHLSHASNLGW